MNERTTGMESKAGLARHRAKAATQGTRRIKVTVPACDAWVIKTVACILREGGHNAQKVRRAVTSMTPVQPARTGGELIDFFRSSPFVGEGIVIERDRSTGRQIDLDSWLT